MTQALDFSDQAEVVEAKPQSFDQIANALAQNLAQGGTIGFADEIGQAGAQVFGSIPVWAMKNVLPESMGGEDVSLAQVYDYLGSPELKQRVMQPMTQFNEENPWTAGGAQLAGSLISGGALAKLAASQFPKAINALSKFAEANPLKAAAGLSAAVGEIYGAGTGEGSTGERLGNALPTAVLSGVLGPVGSRIVSKGASALGSLASKASPVIESAISKVDEALGSISGKPVSEISSTEQLAKLASEKGQVLNLPKGIREGDKKALRTQEEARQGLLGDEAQNIQRGVDTGVSEGAKDTMQSLVGKTSTDDPDDLLMEGIAKFKKRALAEKRYAGKLMNERNEKIANAQIYRDYTNKTLGGKIDEVLNDPQNSTFLQTTSASEVREYANILKDRIKMPEGGKFGKPIDFTELQGWSSSTSAYARANPGTPGAKVANEMVESYNNWLDTITRSAFKDGDDSVVEAIFKANKNYAAFKAKYGTNAYKGQSKIVEDIIQKDELTPRQLVNTVFGKGVGGKDVSGQVVKRILDTMPEGARREAVRNDFRSGLLMRAYKESLNADGSLKLQTLSTKLENLLKNDTYKNHLSSKEYDATIKALSTDLNKYVRAINDPTVRSNSGTGGFVARAFEGLLNNPAIRTATAGQSSNLNGILQSGLKAGRRADVKKFEREFFGKLEEIIDSKHTLYGGIGGAVAGENIAN